MTTLHQTRPDQRDGHTDNDSPQVNVRMPEDLKARLSRYCSRYRVSKASVLREGLIRELDRRERTTNGAHA